MVVAVGCQNLDDTVTDLDDRHIEGAAAEVIHHDLLLFLVVKAICQCGCSRLVDNPLDIKACDLSGILCCLSLCIVEVCRAGNDSLCYLLAQVSLRICLQLLKNHRGNLLRRILLIVNCNSVVGAHVSLDRRHGSVRVRHSLALSRLADQTVAVLCKCNDGRRCALSFAVCDDSRLAAFHDCHAAVCCTKVNSYNLSHNETSWCSAVRSCCSPAASSQRNRGICLYVPILSTGLGKNNASVPVFVIRISWQPSPCCAG